MLCLMLCFSYLAVTYFSTLSDKRLYFQERIIENKIFFFCPHICLETFMILKKFSDISSWIYIYIYTYSFKEPIFFSHYSKAWIFPTVFEKVPEYKIFKNLSIVGPDARCGWEEGWADGRMDGWTDGWTAITNLVVVFQKWANRLN